jgi:hypothetical protein
VDDDANTSSKRRRAVRNTPLTTAPVAGSSTSGRNVPLLTKQTFSVNVTLPHEQVHGLITRKWHMSAYFLSLLGWVAFPVGRSRPLCFPTPVSLFLNQFPDRPGPPINCFRPGVP